MQELYFIQGNSSLQASYSTSDIATFAEVIFNLFSCTVENKYKKHQNKVLKSPLWVYILQIVDLTYISITYTGHRQSKIFDEIQADNAKNSQTKKLTVTTVLPFVFVTHNLLIIILIVAVHRALAITRLCITLCRLWHKRRTNELYFKYQTLAKSCSRMESRHKHIAQCI